MPPLAMLGARLQVEGRRGSVCQVDAQLLSVASFCGKFFLRSCCVRRNAYVPSRARQGCKVQTTLVGVFLFRGASFLPCQLGRDACKIDQTPSTPATYLQTRLRNIYGIVHYVIHFVNLEYHSILHTDNKHG